MTREWLALIGWALRYFLGFWPDLSARSGARTTGLGRSTT